MKADIKHFPAPVSEAELTAARIAAVEGEAITLHNGSGAELALSCLVQPQAGDLVLLCHSAAGNHIVQILQRESGADIRCRIAAGRAFHLQAERIHLTSEQCTEINSARDVQINALDRLQLNGGQLLMHAAGCLIQTAKNCIGQFTDWAVSARHLIRLQGRRQLITAEKEIKVDADIMHMG